MAIPAGPAPMMIASREVAYFDMIVIEKGVTDGLRAQSVLEEKHFDLI
jgi:hypothetical protein